MSALRLACGHFFAESQLLLGERENCFVCSGPLDVVSQLCDHCASETDEHKPTCPLSEPCPECNEHHRDHGMCLI